MNQTSKADNKQNAIKNLNRQLSKVTKPKNSAISDGAQIKLLYWTTTSITVKQTISIRNWRTMLNHLIIYFGWHSNYHPRIVFTLTSGFTQKLTSDFLSAPPTLFSLRPYFRMFFVSAFNFVGIFFCRQYCRDANIANFKIKPYFTEWMLSPYSTPTDNSSIPAPTSRLRYINREWGNPCHGFFTALITVQLKGSGESLSLKCIICRHSRMKFLFSLLLKNTSIFITMSAFRSALTTKLRWKSEGQH